LIELMTSDRKFQRGLEMKDLRDLKDLTIRYVQPGTSNLITKAAFGTWRHGREYMVQKKEYLEAIWFRSAINLWRGFSGEISEPVRDVTGAISGDDGGHSAAPGSSGQRYFSFIFSQ